MSLRKMIRDLIPPEWDEILKREKCKNKYVEETYRVITKTVRLRYPCATRQQLNYYCIILIRSAFSTATCAIRVYIPRCTTYWCEIRDKIENHIQNCR